MHNRMAHTPHQAEAARLMSCLLCALSGAAMVAVLALAWHLWAQASDREDAAQAERVTAEQRMYDRINTSKAQAMRGEMHQ